MEPVTEPAPRHPVTPYPATAPKQCITGPQCGRRVGRYAVQCRQIERTKKKERKSAHIETASQPSRAASATLVVVNGLRGASKWRFETTDMMGKPAKAKKTSVRLAMSSFNFAYLVHIGRKIVRSLAVVVSQAAEDLSSDADPGTSVFGWLALGGGSFLCPAQSAPNHDRLCS
ncbi:hypothetical protein LZ32DRAFT_131982 [Colletotrichum eremochloae]|nr:hypothetical protein LZ32DRAFT_131982 [Colletotrichum eremochloae]